MYYFIVNPNSADGKGASCWVKIKRQIDKNGLRYESMLTEKRGDAREFARIISSKAEGPYTVVAVGGDGTINEVIDGLVLDGTVTLGYIPTGVHNSLARILRLPRKLKKSVKRIIDPKNYRVLDYGVLSYGDDIPKHRRFCIACGIGLGAAIYGHMTDPQKRRIIPLLNHGPAKNLMHGIGELCQSNPVKGYILLDGVRKIEFNRIFLISSRIYSLEKKKLFERRKKYRENDSDGTMQVNVIHGTSKLRLLPLFADAWRSRDLQHSGLRRYNCRDLTIHVDSPMPVHVDGESCSWQNEITLSCVKKKIRMIV